MTISRSAAVAAMVVLLTACGGSATEPEDGTAAQADQTAPDTPDDRSEPAASDATEPLPADVSQEPAPSTAPAGGDDDPGSGAVSLGGDGVAPTPIEFDAGVDLSDAAAEIPCHWDFGQYRLVKCFTVEVPVHWSQPDGPRTQVIAAVYPGDDPQQPTLAVLAGEPGESIRSVGQWQGHKKYPQVFITQRGAGWLDKSYECPAARATRQTLAADTATAQLLRDDIHADCVRSLTDESGVAAAGVLGHARDVAAVISALGIDSWVVHGRGYSAEIVKLLVSSPPAGLVGGILDGPRSAEWHPDSGPAAAAQAALDHLDGLCADNQRCDEMLAPTGMRLPELTQRLVDRYDTQPLTVENVQVFPLDNVKIVVDGSRFAAGVVRMLATPGGAAVLPLVLADVWQQNEGWAYAAGSLAGRAEIDDTSYVAVAARWLTMCSQHASQRADVPAGGFAAVVAGRGVAIDCVPWEDRTVATAPTAAAAARVPVLVLAGGLDPYSRPEDAEAAARAADGTVAVFGWMTHGIWGAQDNCAESVVTRFIARPDTTPSTGCANRAANIPWRTP